MSLCNTLLCRGMHRLASLGGRGGGSSHGHGGAAKLSSRVRSSVARRAPAALSRPPRCAYHAVAAAAAADGGAQDKSYRPIRLGRGVQQRRFTTTSSTTSAGAVASPAAAAADATTKDGDDGKSPRMMLHNTMSRKKEIFTPRDGAGDKVTMYVCGVTVYDYSHIGHARVYVAFDVLYRQLMRAGYDVTYCRNFTDVDDKIIKRANENGEDCDALVDRFIDAFHEDMNALGCLPPTMEPRATQHIGDIIDMTERLIEKGHAYPVDGGDVYFAVDSLPEYGSLSGRKLEDNRAGERVAVDDRKKNAADFALWKAAKPGEPTWDSPWGAGRPGWHIECSAMIEKMLGKQIDIHGGGQDLVFPHHENELAQSTAACRCCAPAAGEDEKEEPFVRYWVHNGFVKVDSEKMSKSLGNFFTIREVTDKYHPFALRWMLLGTHYRAPINYTQRALEESSDRLYYLYQTLGDARTTMMENAAAVAEAAAAAADDVDDDNDNKKKKKKPPQKNQKLSPVAEEGVKLAAETKLAVTSALADDLNTPLAVASLSAPLKFLNDLLTTKKGKKAIGRMEAMTDLVEAVEDTLGAVGLPTEGGDKILESLRELTLSRAGLTVEDVETAVAKRAEARANKDFEESDRIRDELGAKGVALMDGANQVWRPAVVVDDNDNAS